MRVADMVPLKLWIGFPESVTRSSVKVPLYVMPDGSTVMVSRMIAIPLTLPASSNVQEGCFNRYELGAVLIQVPRQTLPVEGGGSSLRISVPSADQLSNP